MRRICKIKKIKHLPFLRNFNKNSHGITKEIFQTKYRVCEKIGKFEKLV